MSEGLHLNNQFLTSKSTKSNKGNGGNKKLNFREKRPNQITIQHSKDSEIEQDLVEPLQNKSVAYQAPIFDHSDTETTHNLIATPIVNRVFSTQHKRANKNLSTRTGVPSINPLQIDPSSNSNKRNNILT